MCIVAVGILTHFSLETRAWECKKNFMLNSTEHKISNAHEYKSIKIFSFFQARFSQKCYFSCL